MTSIRRDSRVRVGVGVREDPAHASLPVCTRTRTLARISPFPALLALLAAGTTTLAAGKVLHPRQDTADPHYATVRLDAAEVGDQPSFKAYVLPPGAERSERYRAKGVFPKRSGGSWLLHLRGWPGGLAGPADILVAAHQDGKTVTSRFPGAMTLARRRIDVALLIDDSRSMRKTDPERLRVSAANLFASIAATRDDVATLTVIGFSGRARLLLPPTPPRESGTITEALGQFEALGSTDMDAAFFMACRVMKDLPESLKMAVVLSDGRDEPGIYRGAHALFQTRRWPAFTIGLSDLADHATLKRISEATGGRYFFSPTKDELASIFRDIALSIHRSVHVTDWRVEPGGRRTIPVDDSISRLTFALAYGNKGASVSLKPPGGTPLPLPAPGNRALLDVPSPLLGTWEASAGEKGNDTLFVTADSDLELIPFPILESATGAAPVEASCVLVRGNAPVPGVDIAAELAGRRVRLYDDGKHGDTAADDGIYGGVVVPDTVAGTHTCTLVAEGRTAGGFAFERRAKLDVDVVVPEPPPSWAHPEVAVFALYPGASAAQHVAMGGADKAELSVALPALPDGLKASCAEPPVRIPADGRADVRIQIGAGADVRPGTYTGKTRVGIGDNMHETTLQIVVMAPSVIVKPARYDFGVIEPGATATGRIEVQLSPTGAVPATVSQTEPARLTGLPEALTLQSGEAQVWTPTVAVPTNALPGPRSAEITLDWGWGRRQIPVTWDVPTPKPKPPSMPETEPTPDREPEHKPERDLTHDPGVETVAKVPREQSDAQRKDDGRMPVPGVVPEESAQTGRTNQVAIAPPVRPGMRTGGEAPGTTPSAPAVAIDGDTTPEVRGPAGTGPARKLTSKPWPLHLLLLLLLAALLFLLIYCLLKYVHVHPMLKYFIVSSAVHALLFLLTMDLLIETRIVKLEEIAPELAVKVEALEESLGFEITPDGPEIDVEETETASNLDRHSAETGKSADHTPSQVSEGRAEESSIEAAATLPDEAPSLAEYDDELTKQTAGTDSPTEEVEIETKSEPTPEQVEQESPIEAEPYEVADLETRDAAESRPTAPDPRENAVEALDTVPQPAEEAAPVSPAELERADPELAPEAVREELVVESKTAPSEPAIEPAEQAVEVQRSEPAPTSEADLAAERPAEGDAAPASMDAVSAEAQAAARELAADLLEKHSMASADVAPSERDAKIAVKLVSAELPRESPTPRDVDRAELTESAEGDRAESEPSRPDAPEDPEVAETEVAELSSSQSAAGDVVPIEAADAGKQAVDPQNVPEVEAVVPVKSAEGADTVLEEPGAAAGAVPRAEADSEQQRATAGPVDHAVDDAQRADVAHAAQPASDVPAAPVEILAGADAKQESAPAPTVAEEPVGSLAKPTETKGTPADSGPSQLDVQPAALTAAEQAERRRGQGAARQPETTPGAATEVAALDVPRDAGTGDAIPLDTAASAVKQSVAPQGVPAVEAVVPVKAATGAADTGHEEPGTTAGAVPRAEAGGEQQRATAGRIGASSADARPSDIAGTVRAASGNLATPVDIRTGAGSKQETAPAPTVAERPVGSLAKPTATQGASSDSAPARLDVQPAGLTAARQAERRGQRAARQPETAPGMETEVAVPGVPRTAGRGEIVPLEAAPGRAKQAAAAQGVPTVAAVVPVKASDAARDAAHDGPATGRGAVPRAEAAGRRHRAAVGSVGMADADARPSQIVGAARDTSGNLSAPVNVPTSLAAKRERAPAPTVAEGPVASLSKLARDDGAPSESGPSRVDLQPAGLATARHAERRGNRTVQQPSAVSDAAAAAALAPVGTVAGRTPRAQARTLVAETGKQAPGQHPSVETTDAVQAPRAKRARRPSDATGSRADSDSVSRVAGNVPRSTAGGRSTRLSAGAAAVDGGHAQAAAPLAAPRSAAQAGTVRMPDPSAGGARSKRSVAPAFAVTDGDAGPSPKMAAQTVAGPAQPAPARLAVQRSGLAEGRRDSVTTGRAAPLSSDGVGTPRLSAAPSTTGVGPVGRVGARELAMVTAKRSPGRQPSPGDTTSIQAPTGKRLVQRPGRHGEEPAPTASAAPRGRGSRLDRASSGGDGTRLQSGVPRLRAREGAPVAHRPSVSPVRGGSAVRTPTVDTGKQAPGTEGLAHALAMNIPTGGAKFDTGIGVSSPEEAVSLHVPAAGLAVDVARSATPGGLASKLPATPRAAPLSRPKSASVPGVRMRELKSHLSFTIGDGKSGRASATVGLARYGGDWDCSPTAMMFLCHQIRERTGMALEATDKVVSLDAPELKKLPFVYMTGHKDFRFTERELNNLREYLENGGYLWADDSTHFNDETFDRAFRREILRALPDARIVKLDQTFPAFNTGYDLTRGYKGYAIPPGDKYRQDYIEGIMVNGRIAVVYTRNDYGDGLNIDPLTHPLKPSLTDLSPAEMQEGATRMGVNMVLHFLTHAGKVEADFLDRAAATLRKAKDESRPAMPAGPTRPFARSATPGEWQHEEWSDAGSMTGEGRKLVLRFQRGPQGKTAVSLQCSPPLELTTEEIVALDVESRLRCGCRLALGIAVGDRFYESQPFYLKPGRNTAFFDMSARTFKTESTNWEYRSGFDSFVKADRLTLLVYSPMPGEITIENARIVAASSRSTAPRMPPVPRGPTAYELRAP